ncbi:MAG: helix-turn-helix transcriptional regulator [Micromonosporaceae bacterium]
MDTRPELDAIDAAICLVLQHRPHATAPELSPVVADVPTEEITESLRRLQADGLVQEIDDSPPRYAAKVAPDTAAEVLTQRHRAYRQRKATARCLVPTPRNGNDGAPEVLVGPDETRRMVDVMMRGARREILAVVKPPYAHRPCTGKIERERLAAGVSYRGVYDRSVLNVPGNLDLISGLVVRGALARTAVSVPMKMVIVDRAVAVIPLQLNAHTIQRSLLVRHSSLVGALARVFGDLWQAAVPFGPGAVPAEDSPVGEPTDEERRILALLASGATDETIARLMDFSPRTAHRRVRELTAKLGVETRFQAGVAAVRQGWL